MVRAKFGGSFVERIYFMSKNKVKLGIVGVGGMGSSHCDYLVNLPEVEMVGVCDIIKERADKQAARFGAKAYYDHRDLFANSGLEAVIIATPHYDHTPISIHAFEQGLHVMSEKPLAVHVNDAQLSIDAYEKARAKNPDLVFGIMFQDRTVPIFKKIKDILDGGELGKLTRATWINTAWFRSQAYYNSGGWRATWGGEGGGTLTNQCPHNLDMYQWLFGLPSRITGFASLGKYHNIEVEDEVTAYYEHANGMIGHFIVSTAECPGTNRLEICGENGKLLLDNWKLVFYRNRQSMLTFLKETPGMFDQVENWYTEIPVPNEEFGHKVVTQRFLRAILNHTPDDLVAHGTDGIRGVTLANGIMLSSFQGKTVEVPIDGDAFVAKLQELIKTSTFVKPVVEEQSTINFNGSFTK